MCEIRKEKAMKKILAILTSIFVLMLSCATAFAEGEFLQASQSNYKDGVTVEADEKSPTGYTATFVYRDATAQKVELYSDCFYLFTPEEGFEKLYKPEEFKPGMYPAGGNAAKTYYVSLEKVSGSDQWITSVPLSSGAFVYNYRITNSSGVTTARLQDPANPTMVNSATGIKSLSSMVYIPYNSEKQGSGAWADRSIELPRTDGKTGTVDTVAYTGARGDQRGLAVYLPYNYDPKRTQPYNVLYLSHGASGDRYGNELRWMNEGAVPNIMDNLIANGSIDPFIVVTMNNQDINFNYADVENEQFNYIMPFVEENYNVSNQPEGRAFAGLSMGGMTTNRMYFNHANDFSYFGIWSYATSGSELDQIATYKNLDKPNLMLGCGDWDFLLGYVNNLAAKLDSINIPYDYVRIPAAHDWEGWQLLYATFAKDYLWPKENLVPGKVNVAASTVSSNIKSADVRIIFDPARSAQDLNLFASSTSSEANSLSAQFGKWFKNDLMAICFEQKSKFGQLIEVEVKPDKKLNTNNLIVYSYNREKNTYAKINTKVWMDDSGYVHFNTRLGGDIILSDGVLINK
jgi:enterochelin esterase-like enzyme